MNILLLCFVLLVAAIGIFLSYPFKKLAFRRIKNIKKIKKQRDIDSWMQMSREERNLHDYEQKKINVERKRALLFKIRKEYQDLRKRKNKSSP